MVNTNDTFIPENIEKSGEYINTDDTRLPSKSEVEPLLYKKKFDIGDCIAGSYIVTENIKTSGKQADIYLVKKFGKTYVAKMYRKGWKASEKLQGFLKEINHPNIVSILDNGIIDGNYFEIYEYYQEGTLEDRDICSFSFLKNIVIPSINEGLNVLHKNGIVHCDIKPSNLFLCDNGKRVVIGDLGLSEYVNKNGKFIDLIRGTPEYAPPVYSLFDTAAISSAFDYGAFGLVICRLALGYSLFYGMSIDEITYVWDQGIEIPSGINVKLRGLIEGLVKKREEDRWGYKDVKRWCEGEFLSDQPRKNILPKSRRQRVPSRLIFGKFGDELIVVETLHQLAVAIKNNWDQARIIVRRRELTDFVKKIDPELAKKINELAYKFPPDRAVFKLLYMVENSNHIFYKGKDYGTLREYLTCLDTFSDEVAIEFLREGLLVDFLIFRNADSGAIKKIEQIINLSKGNDVLAIKSICYSIVENDNLQVDNIAISTLDDFINMLMKKDMKYIIPLIKRDDILAWLYSKGLGNNVFRIKEL